MSNSQPAGDAGYRILLMAIDLSDESAMVAERARALAAAFGSTLHVIHVIEPLSFAYGGDIPMDFSGIQEEIHEQAKQPPTATFPRIDNTSYWAALRWKSTARPRKSERI